MAPFGGLEGAQAMRAQLDALDDAPPLTLADRYGETVAAEAAQNAEVLKRWIEERKRCHGEKTG